MQRASKRLRGCGWGPAVLWASCGRLKAGWVVGADQYMSQNFVVPGPGKVTMTFTPSDGGREQSYDLFDFNVRDSRASPP